MERHVVPIRSPLCLYVVVPLLFVSPMLNCPAGIVSVKTSSAVQVAMSNVLPDASLCAARGRGGEKGSV